MNRFRSFFKPLMWFMALVLAAFVAGCGGGGDGGTAVGPGQVDPVGGVCTAGAACVDLKTAGTYVILAQAGVTNVPTSAVTGNIGASPVTSTAITGFALSAPPTTFTTSAQVTGRVFAADYADPTPAELNTAVLESMAAYNDADGRTPTSPPGLGGGEIGGLTIAPGVYLWGTPVTISTDVTLDAGGNPDAVWIFQMDQGLSLANGMKVTLTGGAKAKNVFWQAFGAVAIGTNARFEGIILSASNITVGTGATIIGRLYTGTSVTLDQNTVTRPAP